ncbi:MAG: M60 family metallopeptidase [Muribaculaceae bacterium]|nr:M60 family metallopeptidase [Muribaculaceae bacterium]
MKKLICFILILTLSSLHFLNAGTIEDGKVYRIKNLYYPNYYFSISGTVEGAVGTQYADNDLKQLWYVIQNKENNGFYFRNFFNGAYLKTAEALYTQWPVTFISEPDEQTMLMDVVAGDGYFIIKPVHRNGDYVYAHLDAAKNIVPWLSTSEASHWDFEEIALEPGELDEMFARFKSTGEEIGKCEEYGEYLEALFADKSATVLRDPAGAKDNPNYNLLPSVLQKMVDKILGNDWSEERGDWSDSYARKYRVQLYEPYSEGSAAAGLAGIQAHTNMNNPTGIVADSGEILYVMVEDEIPDGASLYIGAVPDCGMHNNTTDGFRLKQGLNMVLCNADTSHYFIYYTVNTVKDGVPVRKLSEFKDVKIHIEGGRINGFFNYTGDELYSPDTREDFLYTSSRAVHPMYDLIGKYVILHFFLEDTADTPGNTHLQQGVKSALDPEINKVEGSDYDPVSIMKAWDSMCFSERILMGIQSKDDISDPFNRGLYDDIVDDGYSIGSYRADSGFHYSDYFNNRMMGITLQAEGLYMNATSWRTAYAPGTISTILTRFKHDGLWGPAHEYGHLNQSPIRIAGTTEESNNLFSNVALYFSDNATTSRSDFISDQLKVFNDGKTYLENGTFGTTRMFWQLWCYYHATRHNTKFYPRLYELLRKYPLKRDMTSIPGKLNPRYDMLHFAKMCCVAAGEDLTDFFTAWGFFVPLDNYHIDDYDVYDCVLTTEDIEAVKNEISELGLEKNLAIILIDDRPGSELPSESGHPKEQAGDFGGLQDFIENRGTEGTLEYSITGENVVIEGNGNPGAGFLVYGLDNMLLGFSNARSFTLRSDVIDALNSGEATLFAVGCDNSLTKVKSVGSSDDNDEETAGIEEIFGNDNSPVTIYDLSGRIVMRAASVEVVNSLDKGIYIVRQGNLSKRILVK